MSHIVASTEVSCPNCQTRFLGAFCPHCGQKWAALDPTFHDLAHELTHEFLHLENSKVLRTLWLLIARPGELTCEYFRGHRARSIYPIRLYLTMSVVFFLALTVLPTHTFNFNQEIGKSAKHSTKTEKSQVNFASLSDHELKSDDIIVQIDRSKDISPTLKQVGKRLVRGWEKTKAEPGEFPHFLVSQIPKLMFFMMPIFALLVNLTFFGRRIRYPGVLYFSIHFHAAVFGILTLLLLVSLMPYGSIMWGFAPFIIFGYFTLALKRVWRDRLVDAFVRASFVASIYSTLLISSLLALVVYGFYRLG